MSARRRRGRADAVHSGELDAEESPLDSFACEPRAALRVLEPGPVRRIHGYEVDRDLARHYAFVEVVYLALTGRLPSAAQRRALEACLVFAAGEDPASLPVHTALLARVSGAGATATGTLTASALFERTRSLGDTFAALHAFLTGATRVSPPSARARSAAEARRVASLVDVMPETLRGPVTRLRRPSLVAAIAACLHAAGIERPEHWALLLTLAALPTCYAEAMGVPPGSIRGYPVNANPFSYSEQDR